MVRKIIPLGKAAKALRRREKRSGMPLKKRAVSRVRAMKIARIRCRRRKRVARTEWFFQRFENTLAKLEHDQLAIALFRERRAPKIKERIAEINSLLGVLVKQAARQVAAKEMGRAKKIWQKEHVLEERKRALQAELNLIERLK